MRAFVYSQKDPADGVAVVEVQEPGYIIPWEDSWGCVPDGESRLDIVNLAIQQARHAKLDNPSVAIGGRILLAELSPHHMTFNATGLTAPSKK